MSVGICELFSVPGLKGSWISGSQIDELCLFDVFLGGFRDELIEIVISVDDGDGVGEFYFGRPAEDREREYPVWMSGSRE